MKRIRLLGGKKSAPTSTRQPKYRNPVLCSACLSSDRTLYPLGLNGVNTGVFIKLFDNNYLCQSVVLCWECTAVLNKVRIFKNKVDHAQKVLNLHCLSTQSTPPIPLSHLGTSAPNVISIEGDTINIDSLIKQQEDIWDVDFKTEDQPESGTFLIESRLENDGSEVDVILVDSQEESDNNKVKNPRKSRKQRIQVRQESPTYECEYLSPFEEQVDSFPTSNNEGNDIFATENDEAKVNDILLFATETTEGNDIFATETNEGNEIFATETNEGNDIFATETNEGNDIFVTENTEVIYVFATENNKENDSYKTENEPLPDEQKPDSESDTSEPDNIDPDPPRRDKNDPDYAPSATDSEDSTAMVTSGKEKRKNKKEKPKTYNDCTKLNMSECKSHDMIAEYSKVVTIAPSEVSELMEQERSSAYFADLKSKCEKCVRYIKANSVEGHMKQFHTQTEKRNLICDSCKCTFSSKNAMRTHLSKHSRMRQCLLCDFKCYSRDRMIHHLREHDGQRRCNQCNALFSSVMRFISHYRKEHREFICDYCGQIFATKTGIEKHVFHRHLSFFCKPCRMWFKTHLSYKAHCNSVHLENRTEDAYCVTCDRQFKSRSLYNIHVKKSVAHAAEVGKVEGPVECLECLKTLKNRSALYFHNLYVHKKSYRRYVCQRCGKLFVTLQRLNRHTSTVHLGLKPEKNKICSYCGRGFSASHVLAAHVRTHTGERPYHCAHCDAKFVQRGSIQAHLKTHTKGQRKKQKAQPL